MSTREGLSSCERSEMALVARWFRPGMYTILGLVGLGSNVKS